jgi:hypothetical protein
MKWRTSRHRQAQRRPSSRPRIEFLEDRTVPTMFWGSFAGTAQHTADAPVPSQNLN